MSLYQLSKLLFTLNRDPVAQDRFRSDPGALCRDYALSDDERRAIVERDIGLLYVLGVNGQILMHFAALCAVPWPQYLEMMRAGIREHGPVRAGIYAMTTSADEKIVI